VQAKLLPQHILQLVFFNTTPLKEISIKTFFIRPTLTPTQTHILFPFLKKVFLTLVHYYYYYFFFVKIVLFYYTLIRSLFRTQTTTIALRRSAASLFVPSGDQRTTIHSFYLAALP